MEVPQTVAYTEVVEICALMQCLGFEVKSLENNETRVGEGGLRTITIDCQVTGVHVVLSSTSTSCACLCCFGGKHFDKEFGCSLLGSLPWQNRQHLSKSLAEILRCIQHQPDQGLTPIPNDATRSASMLEMKTPEKRDLKIKLDTPTRYRSLDTLTGNIEGIQELPAPGLLQKCHGAPKVSVSDNDQISLLGQINMISSGVMGSSQVLGPHMPSNYKTKIYKDVVDAEKLCSELVMRMRSIIKNFGVENGERECLDSTIDLSQNASQNSVLTIDEGATPKFASSPNLSSMGKAKDITKDRLKRISSASTSNLTKTLDKKEAKPSLLRRISPSFFKTKKQTSSTPTEKTTPRDYKRTSLPRATIATPVQRKPAARSESGVSTSASKKYSHIKSTIPKPSKK